MNMNNVFFFISMLKKPQKKPNLGNSSMVPKRNSMCTSRQRKTDIELDPNDESGSRDTNGQEGLDSREDHSVRYNRKQGAEDATRPRTANTIQTSLSIPLKGPFSSKERRA